MNHWLNLSAPILKNIFDYCHIFDINYNTSHERPLENTSIIPCTSWEYDTSLIEVRRISNYKQ